jgi:hypothetical protein
MGRLDAVPLRKKLAAARVDRGPLDAGSADIDAENLDGPLLCLAASLTSAREV